MKFLIVSGRPFYPAHSGGRIRSSKLFERIARRHDVTIACFRTAADADENLEAMRACCHRLEVIDRDEPQRFSAGFYRELARNLGSPHAFAIDRYAHAGMRRRIRALAAAHAFDAVICDFLQPAWNVIDLTGVPKILFEHNVESVIRYRQYRNAINPAARAWLFWDWVRLRRDEGFAARRFDHCIMVSEEDCETMKRLYGVTHTSAIPIGVDAGHYRPSEPDLPGHHIVFTGSMDWLPNVDAALHFVRRILPRVARTLDVTFWIVGRNPTAAVRRLARRHANIRITGTVDDVRPFLARAGVVVVPLRVGGGTRLKILEAMAMGRAVVSTRIGAEGLPVTDGEHLVLADSPDEFAAAVIRLLTDAPERRRLGVAAHRLALTLTWDAAADRFLDICGRVVAGSRTARCA